MERLAEGASRKLAGKLSRKDQASKESGGRSSGASRVKRQSKENEGWSPNRQDMAQTAQAEGFIRCLAGVDD